MKRLTKFFLTSGVGHSGTSPLNAFDRALDRAGISGLNLVQVSSVLPYNAIEHTSAPDMGVADGDPVHCAFGREYVEPKSDRNVVCWAAVGIYVPKNPAVAGVIMELHGSGDVADMAVRLGGPASSAKSDVERLVREMATTKITQMTVEAALDRNFDNTDAELSNGGSSRIRVAVAVASTSQGQNASVVAAVLLA